MTPEEKDAARLKRTKTLIGVWDILVASGEIDGECLKLSAPLVNEVIEHYLADLEIIKKRYRIENRIQLHKVAGLMAGAIMRFRPVIPIGDVFTNELDIYANEILSIYHGLAICGEYIDKDERIGISLEPWFAGWIKNFIYLLHHRTYTSESIILIYETLCYSHFPSGFKAGD